MVDSNLTIHCPICGAEHRYPDSVTKGDFSVFMTPGLDPTPLFEALAWLRRVIRRSPRRQHDSVQHRRREVTRIFTCPVTGRTFQADVPRETAEDTSEALR